MYLSSKGGTRIFIITGWYECFHSWTAKLIQWVGLGRKFWAGLKLVGSKFYILFVFCFFWASPQPTSAQAYLHPCFQVQPIIFLRAILRVITIPNVTFLLCTINPATVNRSLRFTDPISSRVIIRWPSCSFFYCKWELIANLKTFWFCIMKLKNWRPKNP